MEQEIKLNEGVNQTKCMKCGKSHNWNVDQFINTNNSTLNQGKMVICKDCENKMTDRDFIYLAEKVDGLRQDREI